MCHMHGLRSRSRGDRPRGRATGTERQSSIELRVGLPIDDTENGGGETHADGLRREPGDRVVTEGCRRGGSSC